MTSESEDQVAARLEEGGGGEGPRDRKKSKKKHRHRSRSMSREKYHDHHHHRRRSRSRSSRRRSRSDSRDRRNIIVKRRSESPRIGDRGGDGDRRSSGHRNSHFHQHNRNVPEPNKCLGVFGLSTRTTEKDLLSIFSKYGHVENCTVVMHGQTGRSRGFSFVYFTSVSDAAAAKEACNGMEIDGSRVRVDFSITQRAHTPTPGIYMGRTRYDDYSRRRRTTSEYRSHYHHSYHHHRTPSPYRRGHSRIRSSRSPSRSPRRHHHHHHRR